MIRKKQNAGLKLAKSHSAAHAPSKRTYSFVRANSEAAVGTRTPQHHAIVPSARKGLRTGLRSRGRRVSRLQYVTIVSFVSLLLADFLLEGPLLPGIDACTAVPSAAAAERLRAISRSLRFHKYLDEHRVGLKSKLAPHASTTKKETLGDFHFTPVEQLYHMKRVEVGTYSNALQIPGGTLISVIPRNISRYNAPWLLLPRVDTLSFAESGNRVLHSTIRESASDGIGHGLTVLNAEISTALLLRLSYTHRVGLYGSISRADPLAVENIFGWGHDEVPRHFVEKELCHVERISHKEAVSEQEKCPVCKSVRKKPTVPIGRIVEIPDSLLYGCTTCHTRRLAVNAFQRKHSLNNTIFQMSPVHCDYSPKSPDFHLSYNFFYWKYWDLHADAHAGSLRTAARFMHGQRYAARATRRSVVNFAENEVSVAIHARRGDFFAARNNRRMVPSRAFAVVVRQVAKTMQHVGGVFAAMPVAVYVYSEGRRAAGGADHDVLHMDRSFLDADGSARDARWFQTLLTGRESADGNGTHSILERTTMFPAGVRTEFRISRDVAESLHEMASADVFVGSESDLSQYAVRIVSRGGLQLLPKYMGAVPGCCAVRFDANRGGIGKKGIVDMEKYWRWFALANERSALRAMGG